MLLVNVTEVTTEHQKLPKIITNSGKTLFLPETNLGQRTQSKRAVPSSKNKLVQTETGQAHLI